MMEWLFKFLKLRINYNIKGPIGCGVESVSIKFI